MKILISAAIAALLTNTTAFTSAAATVDVTPAPAHITDASGEMIITPATTLSLKPQDDAQRLRRYIDTEWRHFGICRKTSRIQLSPPDTSTESTHPSATGSVTPDATTTIEATSEPDLLRPSDTHTATRRRDRHYNSLPISPTLPVSATEA